MFFKVGSYKVHIYSRSVSYSNHRSAQPQCGAAESRSALYCSELSPEKKLNKPPKTRLTLKIYNSSSVRCIENIHSALHRRQTALSFGTTFS